MNKLLYLLTLLPLCATANEAVIHKLATKYLEHDIAGLAGCFSGDARINGRSIEQTIFSFNRLFKKGYMESMSFTDIESSAKGLRAKLRIQGERQCSGESQFTFNEKGYITRWDYTCSWTDSAVTAYQDFGYGRNRRRWNINAPTDPALMGQGADLATTAIGLSAGLTEMNPLMDGAGLPIMAVVKLGASKYAETLPPRDCHAVKNGLTATGWGAAGWNLCAMATAGSGGAAAIPCALLGIFSGVLAHEKFDQNNMRSCQVSASRY